MKSEDLYNLLEAYNNIYKEFEGNNGRLQDHQMHDKEKETVGGLTKQDYEFDNFDIIFEYLVTEGYADTIDNALVIMTNMSKEWRETILEYGQWSGKVQSRYGSTPATVTQKSVSGAVDKALTTPGTSQSASEIKGKTGVTVSGNISYSGTFGNKSAPEPKPELKIKSDPRLLKVPKPKNSIPTPTPSPVPTEKPTSPSPTETSTSPTLPPPEALRSTPEPSPTPRPSPTTRPVRFLPSFL
jgi:hypothetical protein